MGAFGEGVLGVVGSVGGSFNQIKSYIKNQKYTNDTKQNQKSVIKATKLKDIKFVFVCLFVKMLAHKILVVIAYA